MKFALGRKLQMTQLFDEDGMVQPVTVVALEPLEVSMCRTTDRDGYEAVQVRYGDGKQQQRKKEFRGDSSAYEVGKPVDSAEAFSPGDVVRVSATSKGKGFQGVVKRYGFAGGPRTHGQKHNERSPGSIGSGLRNRVPRGTKMPGRVGNDRVTIRGTQVVSIDKDRGLLLLHGSIPGRRGTLVEIQGV